MTVETAETFDLVGALEGTSYPTKVVSIYLNIQAVSEFHALEEEAATLTAKDTERNDEILAEQGVLRDKILASVLNVELIGLPRSVVKAVVRKLEVGSKNTPQADLDEKINRALLVRSVAKISNHTGATAEATEENIDALLGKMTEEVYGKFIKAMTELSFESMRYETIVTDPNFS